MEKNIPLHLGIILDGNRRWARAKGLSTIEGHRRGFFQVKKIARHAYKRGIKILTVYAFSTENWQRSKEEVNYLMRLFKLFVNKELTELIESGIKINFFGRIEDFDKKMQKDIERAQAKSKAGQAGVFNVCLSYGGRDEIVRAVKKIAKQQIPAEKINEQLIADNLDSAGLPDPDMIIRTSGEQRLSGFLTWQSVYSELYFPSKHWPDFDTKDLDEAITQYQKRNRRFGGN